MYFVQCSRGQKSEIRGSAVWDPFGSSERIFSMLLPASGILAILGLPWLLEVSL